MQIIHNSRSITGWLLALLGLFAILLVSSVITNVVLAARLREAGELLAKQNPPALKPGTQVPAIRARDLQKQPQQIEFSTSSAPTLLYVFTPSCGWCTKNLENIKVLAKHVGNKYRLIGLSLSADGLTEYVAQNEIDFPVLTEPDQDTVRSYRLGATPASILISPEGRVLKTWVGAWAGRTRAEIESQFGLRLPGFTPEKSQLTKPGAPRFVQAVEEYE
jgi:peroxiredoxin